MRFTDFFSWPLKDRFLIVVVNGEIGRLEKNGVVVSLMPLNAYFLDTKSNYINSFLPAKISGTT